MSSTKGVYFLVFVLLMSSLAIAVEQVAESKGSFDVSVGEGTVLIDSGISQQEFCGNDIKEGSEQCDGTDLGGASCSSSLGSNFEGTLSCQPNCVYNTSSCSEKIGGGTTGGGPSGGSSTIVLDGRTRRESSCIESWQCLDWSPCFNGKQARTCTDTAKCGTETLKPIIERTCEEDKGLKISGEGSAFNRLTLAAIGALRSLKNYEIVGIILFILAIVGSALIINSIRRPEESSSQVVEKVEAKAETKPDLKEKSKNSKKVEKEGKAEK